MMAGDINDDGIDEIITFTESIASIYSSSKIDLTIVADGCPAPRPQQKRHYLFTRYWGGEYVKNAITTGVVNTRLKMTPGTACRNTLCINGMSNMATLDASTTINPNCAYQLFNLQGKMVARINTINVNAYQANFDDMSRGTYLQKALTGNLHPSENTVLNR